MIIGVGMGMCTRHESEAAVGVVGEKPAPWDSDGRLKVGSAVIVCNIIAGLGDVNWALNIAKEVEEISNGRVTVVFYGAYKHAVEFLSRIREVEYIENLEEECGGGDKAYICTSDISNREINKLQEKYELVITFHVFRGTPFLKEEMLSRKVIDVLEYENSWRGGAKMFLKDYNELYGEAVDATEGYAKVCVKPCVKPSEFKKRLGKKERKGFKEDYLFQMIPSEPYYFAYFACMEESLDSKVSFLTFVCRQL